jgi:mycothiol synthase
MSLPSNSDRAAVPQLFMRRPSLEDLAPLPVLAEHDALREARSDDAAALAGVLSSAFGQEWTVERVREALLDAPDVDTTFVVTSMARPVATASSRLDPERYPGSGYLHWVGVHASARGRQLGRAVSLAVLYRFRDLGCRDAVLETDPPRFPAIRIYLHLGFVPEPRVPAHETIWRDILMDPRMAGVATVAASNDDPSRS